MYNSNNTGSSEDGAGCSGSRPSMGYAALAHLRNPSLSSPSRASADFVQRKVPMHCCFLVNSCIMFFAFFYSSIPPLSLSLPLFVFLSVTVSLSAWSSVFILFLCALVSSTHGNDVTYLVQHLAESIVARYHYLRSRYVRCPGYMYCPCRFLANNADTRTLKRRKILISIISCAERTWRCLLYLCFAWYVSVDNHCLKGERVRIKSADSNSISKSLPSSPLHDAEEQYVIDTMHTSHSQSH